MLYKGQAVRDKNENREASQESILVFQVTDDKNILRRARTVNMVGFGIYFGSRTSKSYRWIWLGCEAKRRMEVWVTKVQWPSLDMGRFGGKWMNLGRDEIKSLTLAMLNLRCQLDIQVEIQSWEMHIQFRAGQYRVGDERSVYRSYIACR